MRAMWVDSLHTFNPYKSRQYEYRYFKISLKVGQYEIRVVHA